MVRMNVTPSRLLIKKNTRQCSWYKSLKKKSEKWRVNLFIYFQTKEIPQKDIWADEMRRNRVGGKGEERGRWFGSLGTPSTVCISAPVIYMQMGACASGRGEQAALPWEKLQPTTSTCQRQNTQRTGGRRAGGRGFVPSDNPPNLEGQNCLDL